MIITIPARLHSTRLPRKLLLNETGHPLIWHTIQRALEVKQPTLILVLTEDMEIFEVVRDFKLKPVEAILTGPAISGTDRIAQFVSRSGIEESQIVVNLQGDEPELSGKYVDLLAESMSGVDVATLASPATVEDANSPSVVKVVLDHSSLAMYFSRAPIPYAGPWLKHMGIYAYRAGFLNKLQTMRIGAIENERLEQLRWLESGHKIRVVVEEIEAVGVDTQEEYAAFVRRYNKGP